ncbi:hypothetical protein [Teichococcus oryzae]|uniref:Serine protease n=1 Tax=Teichococcus oryzae TaxID=1608942 RepID=A0A5B2TJY1_9PROT|nr:hypothetical protein [Pseudoroseomonas oryzae]KAA2214315.1 hypothetical protein F0Q34_00850 [Pseudoroseomonas oryzae]
MSDDIGSPVLPRPSSSGGAVDGGGSRPMPPPASRPLPGEGMTEFSFAEVEGDPVVRPVTPAESSGVTETSAEAHAEVGMESAESAGDMAEATPEQMAASGAESGEESAFSDLRGMEGFVMPSPGAESTVLQEAGAGAEGGQQEFFPILAALVPTLVSTVGPMVAKAVNSRLSPRAQAAVKRVAALPKPSGPRPPATSGAGGLASLLPLLAKLLQNGVKKAGESGATESFGAESGGVEEAVVTEAVAAMEVILGTDERLPILRTTEDPWRRYCALRITFPSGATYRGTGFFIGPRAVATAGHCVFLKNQGGWARKVEVIPGCNGTKRPFGQVEATIFRSVGGWVSSQLPECDYGCILLPDSAFNGKKLGHFGVAAFDAAALVAQPAVIAGYHGDKPFAELWGMADFIKTVGPKTLGYQIDTAGGCSGAPVYIKRGGQRFVVGIHNYGATTGNSATRITQPVYQRLLQWSKM